MRKAIVFDFFGVIHDDPLKLWLLEVPESLNDDVYRAARSLDVGATNIDGFVAKLSEISGHNPEQIRQYFAKAKIKQDTVEILKILHENYTLCLLTNSHTDEIEPILQRHNLRPLFTDVVISSEIGKAKPDYDVFAYALSKLRVSAHEVIFIDDSLTNVEAAKRLGFETVHFTNAKELKDILCAE